MLAFSHLSSSRTIFWSLIMNPNILGECAQHLIETAALMSNTTQALSLTTTTSTSSTPPGLATALSTTTHGTTPTLILNTNTVREEYNRIFGYRPPSTARSQERIQLILNGLGEKKIYFSQNGSGSDVHDAIVGAFPTLENVKSVYETCLINRNHRYASHILTSNQQQACRYPSSYNVAVHSIFTPTIPLHISTTQSLYFYITNTSPINPSPRHYYHHIHWTTFDLS